MSACSNVFNIFLRIAIVASLSISLIQADDPGEQNPIAVMNLINNYFINNPAIVGNFTNDTTYPGSCRWARASYFTGSMAHYYVTKNFIYIQYASSWAASFNWEMCDSSAVDHNPPNFADNLCIAQTIAELYGFHTSGSSLKNAESTMNIEVADNDWWWIDALFMAMPAYARIAFFNQTVSNFYLDKMFRLYSNTSQLLWNKEYSLFYRDASAIPLKTANGFPVLWSRGNGWAFAAFARTLQYLPATNPYRAEFIEKMLLMARKLKQIQGSDGFWRSSLADYDEYPGVETTSTALFTYGLAWGMNNGILSMKEFKETVKRAWKGISTIAVQPSGFVGYCQEVGFAPGSTNITSTTDYCVGQVLLAGAEVSKLEKKWTIDS